MEQGFWREFKTFKIETFNAYKQNRLENIICRDSNFNTLQKNFVSRVVRIADLKNLLNNVITQDERFVTVYPLQKKKRIQSIIKFKVDLPASK